MREESHAAEVLAKTRERFAALNRRDWDAATQPYAADATFQSLPLGVTVYHGVDAAREVVARWSESWSDYSGEIEEVIDAGEAGVIVALHTTARGAASGVDVDVRVYPHIKTREGKLVYLYEYVDRDDALKAVGLI
jgi:ketosteroid isomerase-like protein